MKKYLSTTIAATVFTTICFLLGLTYLGGHVIFLTGRLTQKADMACIGTYEMIQLENTLDIAQTICVDIQKNQLDEIKNKYKLDINSCQEDAKYWKDSYFWLKKQEPVCQQT